MKLKVAPLSSRASAQRPFLVLHISFRNRVRLGDYIYCVDSRFGNKFYALRTISSQISCFVAHEPETTLYVPLILLRENPLSRANLWGGTRVGVPAERLVCLMGTEEIIPYKIARSLSLVISQWWWCIIFVWYTFSIPEIHLSKLIRHKQQTQASENAWYQYI